MPTNSSFTQVQIPLPKGQVDTVHLCWQGRGTWECLRSHLYPHFQWGSTYRCWRLYLPTEWAKQSSDLMSLREQRGWPVVPLSPSQQAGLAQGLSHGSQSSISVRTLIVMLSLPPWMWAWCSPGQVPGLDNLGQVPYPCLSLCATMIATPPWGREGSRLGQRSSWITTWPLHSYPAEGRGLVSAPCGSLRVGQPQLVVLGWYLGWKGSFHWRHPPQGPWAESSLMGDLGRAPQCRDIPGKLGDWKNRLWCFNWDIPLPQSRLIQGGEVTCRAMRLFSSSRWRYWGWNTGNHGVGEEEQQILDLFPYGLLTVPSPERHSCHLPVIYLPLLRVVIFLVSAADVVKAAPPP